MSSRSHLDVDRSSAEPLSAGSVAERLDTIRAEVDAAVARLSAHDIATFDQALLSTRRIYVAGQGRSGLVGRSFAQRLMHIGFEAYAVGDVIAPAIGTGDLFVAITGSGRTETTIRQATKAQRAGARIVAVTEVADGELVDIAEHVVRVPSRPPIGPTSGQHGTTLFGQVSQMLFDVLCSLLQQQLHQSEGDLDTRHSNLE